MPSAPSLDALNVLPDTSAERASTLLARVSTRAVARIGNDRFATLLAEQQKNTTASHEAAAERLADSREPSTHTNAAKETSDISTTDDPQQASGPGDVRESYRETRQRLEGSRERHAVDRHNGVTRGGDTAAKSAQTAADDSVSDTGNAVDEEIPADSGDTTSVTDAVGTEDSEKPDSNADASQPSLPGEGAATVVDVLSMTVAWSPSAILQPWASSTGTPSEATGEPVAAEPSEVNSLVLDSSVSAAASEATYSTEPSPALADALAPQGEASAEALPADAGMAKTDARPFVKVEELATLMVSAGLKPAVTQEAQGPPGNVERADQPIPGLAKSAGEMQNLVATTPQQSTATVKAATTAGATERTASFANADLEALAVRSIRYLVNSGEKSMSVRLSPASLGEMRIEISSVNDVLNVRLVPTNPAAREMLVQQVDSLRDALASNGVEVGRVVVAGGMAFAGNQQSAQQQASSFSSQQSFQSPSWLARSQPQETTASTVRSRAAAAYDGVLDVTI